MSHLRKALTIAGAALAMTVPLIATGSPAHAEARNGVCESGEFCYYYFSNQTGSVSDFTVSVANYGTTQPTCYDFKGPGSGQGQCIKNNAMSVRNRSGSAVRVFFNSFYGGTSQLFGAGSIGNLNASLSNNNASHRFGG
jgi:hypothetical protein